jgi:hypothetical protein
VLGKDARMLRAHAACAPCHVSFTTRRGSVLRSIALICAENGARAPESASSTSARFLAGSILRLRWSVQLCMHVVLGEPMQLCMHVMLTRAGCSESGSCKSRAQARWHCCRIGVAVVVAAVGVAAAYAAKRHHSK